MDRSPSRIAIPLTLCLLTCFALGPLGCSDQGQAPEPPRPSAAPSPEPDPPGGEPAEVPAPEPPKQAEAPDPAALLARGRSVYAANCTACHNPDPSVDGALGPAVTGSSMELLHLRVIEARYPEGYTPKRDSGMMMALPHLKDDIPALHAFLNQS